MCPYLYQRTEALPSSVFFKQPEFDPINFNIPAISCVAAGLPQLYGGKLTASAAVGTQAALTRGWHALTALPAEFRLVRIRITSRTHLQNPSQRTYVQMLKIGRGTNKYIL